MVPQAFDAIVPRPLPSYGCELKVASASTEIAYGPVPWNVWLSVIV